MNVTVEKISKEDWSILSENAHRVCFNNYKPKELDRIDFALIVRDDMFRLMGYLTCREFDRDTLYWQFGGAFIGTKNTSNTWVGYQAFAAYCKKDYKRVTTLIENTNVVMLKMAMKLGFRIVGIRNFKGDILLEHLLEFENGI